MKYDKDTFEGMIADWKADGAPEYDDLVIDEPELGDDGNWMASAHDDKVVYLLTDDGDNNIVINYCGAR